MPSEQLNATTHNPNGLNLTQVAVYERLINAPIERVWENVLDWEHLPWLHKSSFNYVELIDAGQWGWRTWSNASHTNYVELLLAPNSSYVARSYTSGTQVSEIWTTLSPIGDKTDVKVEFDLTDIEPADAPRVGDRMRQLYSTLWDEDEAMIATRQRRLLEVRQADSEIDLGTVAALEAKFNNNERVIFQLRRKEFQLRLTPAGFSAHAAICPHLLGPLTDSTIDNNTIRCPWHGYVFDLATGKCINPSDTTCQLPSAPTLTQLNGQLIASLPPVGKHSISH